MPDDTIDEEGGVPADEGFSFMDPTEEEYDVFDPSASDEITPIGPEALSEAPLDGTTPVTADQDGAEVALPGRGDKPPPKFDERYREPLEGLMFLGALKKTFTWMGHEFIIRTLTTDELIEVGLLIQPYSGTAGANKAYQTASIAAAILEVDGEPVAPPVSKDKSELVNKFMYIKKNWYPVTVDVVYQQMLELEATVAAVLQQMGEPQG